MTRLVATLTSIVLALGAGPALAAKKPPAAGFTPSVLAGTWTGTWRNQTFNSTGTLTLKISATAATLGFTASITGNTFGCPAPPPVPFTLAKGTGANRWSAKGFSVGGASPAFGKLSITYGYPAGTLIGGGSDPDCAKGLSWRIAGKFTAKAFTATASIVLPDGSPATTVVALTRR